MSLPSSLNALASIPEDRYWKVSETFVAGKEKDLTHGRKIVKILKQRFEGDPLKELTQAFLFARESINFHEILDYGSAELALQHIERRYTKMSEKIASQSCFKRLWLWFIMHFSNYNLHLAFQNLSIELQNNLNKERNSGV